MTPEQMRIVKLEAALATVLDQVDYTTGACGPTEMVGAVLPKEVIRLAREALEPNAHSGMKLVPKEPTLRERKLLEGKTGVEWLDGWGQL